MATDVIGIWLHPRGRLDVGHGVDQQNDAVLKIFKVGCFVYSVGRLDERLNSQHLATEFSSIKCELANIGADIDDQPIRVVVDVKEVDIYGNQEESNYRTLLSIEHLLLLTHDIRLKDSRAQDGGADVDVLRSVVDAKSCADHNLERSNANDLLVPFDGLEALSQVEKVSGPIHPGHFEGRIGAHLTQNYDSGQQVSTDADVNQNDNSQKRQ